MQVLQADQACVSARGEAATLQLARSQTAAAPTFCAAIHGPGSQNPEQVLQPSTIRPPASLSSNGHDVVSKGVEAQRFLALRKLSVSWRRETDSVETDSLAAVAAARVDGGYRHCNYTVPSSPEQA